MAICFRTLNEPDKFYKSANICYRILTGHTINLTISDEGVYNKNKAETEAQGYDPRNTEILLDYNNMTKNAVLTFKSPTNSYIRNIKDILTIEMKDEIPNHKFEGPGVGLDKLLDLFAPTIQCCKSTLNPKNKCGGFVTEKSKELLTLGEIMDQGLHLLINSNNQKTPIEAMTELSLQKEKERLDTQFNKALENCNSIKESINSIRDKYIKYGHNLIGSKEPSICTNIGDNNYEIYFSHNGKKVIIEDGRIKRNDLSYEEYKELDKYFFKSFNKHLPIYKFRPKQEVDKFKVKDFNPSPISGLHPAVDMLKKEMELIDRLKGYCCIPCEANNKIIGDSLKREQENKIHRYPLIYKLKERTDYKNMKTIFDKCYVGKQSFAALVYDHVNDKCVIQLIPRYEPNYTILDVWDKSKNV